MIHNLLLDCFKVPLFSRDLHISLFMNKQDEEFNRKKRLLHPKGQCELAACLYKLLLLELSAFFSFGCIFLAPC